MGGDKPLPYKENRRGGVYPGPRVIEYCKRLSFQPSAQFMSESTVAGTRLLQIRVEEADNVRR